MSSAGGKLGDGMVIVGSIRARLLGFQLLKLDADVMITPASERHRARAVVTGRPRPSLASSNGTVGGSLDETARALEATTGELRTARTLLP